MEMQLAVPQTARAPEVTDRSIGRIVSVTGSKAIVLLDGTKGGQVRAADPWLVSTLHLMESELLAAPPESRAERAAELGQRLGLETTLLDAGDIAGAVSNEDGPRGSHGDHELSASAPLDQPAESVRHPAERIRLVDDGQDPGRRGRAAGLRDSGAIRRVIDGSQVRPATAARTPAEMRPSRRAQQM